MLLGIILESFSKIKEIHGTYFTGSQNQLVALFKEHTGIDLEEELKSPFLRFLQTFLEETFSGRMYIPGTMARLLQKYKASPEEIAILTGLDNLLAIGGNRKTALFDWARQQIEKHPQDKEGNLELCEVVGKHLREKQKRELIARIG